MPNACTQPAYVMRKCVLSLVIMVALACDATANQAFSNFRTGALVETPHSMAMQLELELSRGSGIMAPDLNTPVIFNMGSVPLPKASQKMDNGFPAEFMNGLVAADEHGFTVWPVWVCVSDEETGDVGFYAADGSLVWTEFASGAYSKDWILRLRRGVTSEMLSVARTNNELPEAESRMEELLSPARVVLRYTFIDAAYVPAYGRAVAEAREATRSGNGQKSVGRGLNGEQLFFSAIRVDAEGVSLDMEWNDAVTYPTKAFLDVLDTDQLDSGDWSVIRSMRLTKSEGSVTFDIPGEEIDGFFPPPIIHDPYHAVVTNIVCSPLDPLNTAYTNFWCECPQPAALVNRAHFFKGRMTTGKLVEGSTPVSGIVMMDDDLWLSEEEATYNIPIPLIGNTLATFPFSFPFEFGGFAPAHIMIAPRGLVYLVKDPNAHHYPNPENVNLSEAVFATNCVVVAAFWDILRTGGYSNDTVVIRTRYAQETGESVIAVCYEDVMVQNNGNFSENDSLSFQIIFREDHPETITVAYRNVNGTADGRTASLGVQNPKANPNYPYAYREIGKVHSGLTLTYYHKSFARWMAALGLPTNRANTAIPNADWSGVTYTNAFVMGWSPADVHEYTQTTHEYTLRPPLRPQDICLVVNGSSSNSVWLAEEYAAMRNIPPENIVTVHIPASYYTSTADWTSNLTPAEFTDMIWTPVINTLTQRGIYDKMLALVYSCDFPIRILFTDRQNLVNDFANSQSSLSLTGITFLRNKINPNLAQGGMGSFNSIYYNSPLFAGPANTASNALIKSSLSFATLQNIITEEMPLPSMMLGYTQNKGNTTNEILSCLQRGVASDYTNPTGVVYLAKTSDIYRSPPRHVYFERAATMILEANGNIGVTNDFSSPIGEQLVGYMTGIPNISPLNATFLPGAFADHLTSFAGAFDRYSQTKMSTWIAQGATATSGTVCEPYPVWEKFPNAYVFLHQQKGLTLIESIYLSIKWPLQQLIIGEPLANPYKKEIQP